MLSLRSIIPCGESRPAEGAPPLARRIPPCHFHCASGVSAQILACNVDSLARVTRRDRRKDFVNILRQPTDGYRQPINASAGRRAQRAVPNAVANAQPTTLAIKLVSVVRSSVPRNASKRAALAHHRTPSTPRRTDVDSARAKVHHPHACSAHPINGPCGRAGHTAGATRG